MRRAISSLMSASAWRLAAPGAAVPEGIWAEGFAAWCREVAPEVPKDHVLVEPQARNTAPAIALAAVRHGKHVLVEKPAAVCVAELDRLEAAAKQSGALVRVGYNHRFHPAALKAVELFRGGALGPMMFVRGRYGQGGRIGYEKEWRADPKLSGGGELIDQGVHLIDLAGIFLG